MQRITDRIYIGNSHDAMNAPAMKKIGITAMLNVAHDLDCCTHEDVLSFKCGLTDGPWPFNTTGAVAAVKLLRSLQVQYRTLVYDHTGLSRSPFIVSLALEWAGWEGLFRKLGTNNKGMEIQPWMRDVFKEMSYETPGFPVRRKIQRTIGWGSGEIDAEYFDFQETVTSTRPKVLILSDTLPGRTIIIENMGIRHLRKMLEEIEE